MAENSNKMPMVHEVIDLISSSPDISPVLSAERQAPIGGSRLPHKTHDAGLLGVVDLAGLSDEFDDTGDIDSPAKPLQPDSPTDQTREVRPSHVARKADSLLGFDDVDAFDAPSFTQTAAAAKRRRLSPSPGAENRTATQTIRPSPAHENSTSHGLSSFHSRPPRTKQTFDPLQSSDPFASSPPQSPARSRHQDIPVKDIPPKPRQPISPTKAHAQDRPVEVAPIRAAPSSPDPFADSPPPNPRRAGPGHRHSPHPLPAPSSSNPFADTPMPETRPTKVAQPAPSSSNPFADSPIPDPRPAKLPNRQLLDIESSSPQPAAATSRSVQHRQQWDPISSSAPEATTDTTATGPGRAGSNLSGSHVIEIDSNSEFESDDELPDIHTLVNMPWKARSALGRSRSEILPPRERTNVTASSRPSRAKIGRATGKTAAEKEAEKEQKRKEKTEAKEAKLREKERAAALAEVNKMRTDKKISTPEMIVNLPASLDVSIKTHAEILLQGLSVEYKTWVSPHNAIKWRRKVKSRFNEEAGHWEPIPLRIMDESHAVVIVAADEFVRMALEGDVGNHAGRVHEAFPEYQVVYLIEGLTPWMRKNRNLRNRQFASGVRAREEQQQQAGTATSSGGGRRRNAGGTEAVYVPEHVVEDALLELQVMHDVLIHHTSLPLETAQWIAILTQHISTIPYRKQRDLAMFGAAFCMESGQVKTGDDARGTYICMLQEIARVTAPIAHGVAMEFGSVTELVKGMESGGPTRLEGVRKTVNQAGELSDRTVGQAVSRRMHKVFTGRDESSTDI